MRHIDASHGEGGGQVLRTALSLSALTGTPVRLTSVRARRKNPGLAPQHLTCVLALAQICDAQVRGAALRSTEIEFAPQSSPKAGEYVFDVADAAAGGSAGSVTLLFQALLYPLLKAPAPSSIVLRGGTHVRWSPSYHYLADVCVPAIARLGARVSTDLQRWGFYPAGGGEMTATIAPGPLRAFDPCEPGPVQRVHGIAAVTNLPAHIPQRMATRSQSLLAQAGLSATVSPLRARSAGPGAGTVLTAEYAHTRTSVTALGEKGKSSERVAEEAVAALLERHPMRTYADPFLADQLVLPSALAGGPITYDTSRVSLHLLTMAWLVPQFLDVAIEVAGEEGEAGQVSIRQRET